MERTGRPKIRIRDEEVKAILFRNFAGAPDRFNPNGTMGNFWVVLEEEKAIVDLIKSIDTDLDGKISFEEYYDMMLKIIDGLI